ncbi:TonB-dependent receptor [Aliiglaciecola sp. CAU 1673]|uniref:TonB-dependent receptor n=1 Tax=Aliiglaciecola sp. CAU 1673 TaxID=3032595 RepID=UPI0023DA3862|nr:TonB-dependent receptor [Aliiglaciecola sp. CAU 1673]MDF2178784.1 TonB-dependent receptor [Aliiglaciecola sp. CAU 1673]
MKSRRYSKTKIATSLSLILGSAAMMPAYAQDQDQPNANNDGPVEIIAIKGIRGSLIRAMDMKREGEGVVDGISAEDIGKFPDTNLAESLQRITGVSIDRQNGEGSKVTVRGMGPDYNLVTLNGRQMPTSSLEATSASSSRSFDFANLASEGVAGVEVFKTSRADNPTGGIGSTINILTTRPLNAPGMNATFGVKGVVDTSSEENSGVTPEISGLYSNTFADDTFGVAISGSYQERDSGNQQANVGTGWRSFSGVTDQDWGAGTADWGGIPDGPNSGHVNRPGPDSIYSVPQSLGYSFNEIQRKRTNGQVVFQYRPVDDVTATLDYTYSKNEVAQQFNDLSAWFNFGPSTGEWTDGPIASPLIYAEQTPANPNDPNSRPADFSMGAGDYATTNENKSLGFNVEWQVNDKLELEFDVHDSSAESGPDSPWGSNNVLSAATWVREETTAYFDQDFPVLELTYPQGLNSIRPQDMRITGSSFRNSLMRSDIKQYQVKGEYAFDDGIISSINFGVGMTDVDNRSAFSNVQRDTWGGVGQAGDFDDSFWPLDTVANYFDIPGSSNPLLQNEFFRWDFNKVRARAAELYAVSGAGDCGNGFCASSDYTTDRRTQEESAFAYVQSHLIFDIGDMPANLYLGLRYEETEVASQALVPTYSNIAWVGANEFNLVPTGDREFTSLTGDYDYWLPNVNFDVELVEDVVLRASVGKTIGRPGYADIQGGQTIDSLVRIDGGTGARGNPNLLPLESTNFDFSAEWYYDEGSYASIGYYRKDVKNFIGNTQVVEQVFDLPHPAQGSRYAQAVAAVGLDNVAIRNYIIENFPDSVNAADEIIFGVAGDDAPATFRITVPINDKDAKLTGWELAVQHLFGESGFGVIANLTLADADVSYDNFTFGEQFAIIGLSDSANFVGFYDKDGIQVRLAYNWRDEFLSGVVTGTGLHPTYTEAYGQWDLNLSYDVNDNLTLFAEGLNITDEYTRTHGRANEQVLNVTQTGPRYNLGLRYKF